MSRPFRFGVQIATLPAEGWIERVRRIESLGYSTVFVPDHFGSQWEPTATIAAAAAVTERLRVGSLVYDVDYRHPVVLAKAAATTHVLSGGRHEFGIGAGWMESDYVEAGMTYDRPGVRISRLEEALQIMGSMWTQDKTSFEGEHYRITEIAKAIDLPEGERPTVLIGGGGKRVLSLAGRYADIVGINPSLVDGKITAETAADLAPENVKRKIEWARAGAEQAGRDPDSLEYNGLAFVVALADDVSGLRNGLAASAGMTAEQVADCPIFLTGSPNELRDRLEKRREQTGISYTVIPGKDLAVLEQFAEAIVEPLAGK